MAFLFTSTQTLFSSLASVSTYCQKHLVRQCLASAVDTNRLPLDAITIRWTLRECVLELRGVGLRLDALAAHLDLPAGFALTEASVGLLRLTIPTTGSNAIVVEVESATLRLSLADDEEVAHHSAAAAEQAGNAAEPSSLPGANLHTIVDSAPTEDKADLEAALPTVEGALVNFLRSFRASFAAGPSSVARLIKDGALNRLRLSVRDVAVRVDMGVQDQTTASTPPPMVPVSATLRIAELTMGENAQLPSTTGTKVERKRQITIQQIQAYLMSDPEVFASHARFSPAAPPFAADVPFDYSPPFSPASRSIDSRVDSVMMQSTVLEPLSVQSDASSDAVDGALQREREPAHEQATTYLQASAQPPAVSQTSGGSTPGLSKSMYMSALSTAASEDSEADVSVNMPGGFAASRRWRPYDFAETVQSDKGAAVADERYAAVTSARRLLEIANVSITLLAEEKHNDRQQQSTPLPPEEDTADPGKRQVPMMESTVSTDFSAFSTILPPQENVRKLNPSAGESFVRDDSLHPTQAVHIEVPSIQLTCDISCSWLVAKMVSRLRPTLRREPRPSECTPRNEASHPRLKFTLRNAILTFAERLPPMTVADGGVRDGISVASGASSIIMQVKLRDLKASRRHTSRADHASLSVGHLCVGCGGEELVRFGTKEGTKDLKHSELTQERPDISVNITSTADVVRLNIVTLPLLVTLNIAIIDETLGWFGGLSSILDLGISVASDTTAKASSKSTVPRKVQSVRFHDECGIDQMNRDAQPFPINGPVCKVNMRIAGFTARLIGEECSAKLETSALKIVARTGRVGVQIDQAWCSGPHLSGDVRNGDAAGILNVGNLRIEYSTRSQEADLDTLLALLTPSKDKFEPDDDVILDTLFKQRMGGPVLRITAGSVAAKLADLTQLRLLTYLGDDLKKLAKVTKYLPEDDQPGILAIIRLQEVTVDASLGEPLGLITATLRDSEAAYVALPPLSAGKIGTMKVLRNKTDELIGPAMPVAATARLGLEEPPMIMGRFISEEIEPTIKLKLYKLRVEYHVPTILAALGLKSAEVAEELAAEVTRSLSHLTESSRRWGAEAHSTADDCANPGPPRRISTAFRDCHVGLTCQRTPARGLFVISSGHLAGELEGEGAVEASLQLHRASLLLIDDVGSVAQQPTPTKSRSVTGDAHTQQLCDLGYVSVSSISSAIVTVRAATMEGSQEKSVEVAVKDNLLILETCADSAQTLIAILNSLSLPTPPVRDQKYRTEVIPIQEMLQSLNHEAFFPPLEKRSDPPRGSAADGFAIPDEPDYVSDFSPVLPDPVPILPRRRTKEPATSETCTSTPSVASNVSVASSFSNLTFEEDHFARRLAVEGTAHRWDSVNNTYSHVNDSKLLLSPLRIRVRNVHVIWNLFDGYDWKRTRDEISKAVQKVQADAAERGRWVDGQYGAVEDDEASVVGDFLFNSIYIDIPSNRDPQSLTDMINHDINDYASETTSHNTSTTVTAHHRSASRTNIGGRPLRLARSKRHKITFELKGISADLVVFPPGLDETQSSLDIRVHDLEIFDHLTTSTWKKFATYMHDAGERELDASMIHIEILNVKPVPDLAASEIVLKATVLPLRLHVDQDALDFLTRFFAFKDDSVQPVMSLAEQPFIQRAEINSIPVKLDFKPKRVDYGGLRSGRTTEFMNFFVLDEANMVLRHCIIYGILGFEKLGQTLNDIWMPDVKANQLPGVLAGLAPIKPLIGVGSGFRNLVVVPVREYRKDGRVVRSLQKGAASFAKTTTTELVKLGAKLAIGTQTVLQSAENFFNVPPTGAHTGSEPMLPAGPWEDISIDENEKAHISLYADQPIGVTQGLRGGYASLGRDLTLARDAIVAVPGEITECGSAAQAARALIKRAPTIILRPAIGASKAVGQTLLGVGNTLDPAQRRRNEDVSSATTSHY